MTRPLTLNLSETQGFCSQTWILLKAGAGGQNTEPWKLHYNDICLNGTYKPYLSKKQVHLQLRVQRRG